MLYVIIELEYGYGLFNPVSLLSGILADVLPRVRFFRWCPFNWLPQFSKPFWYDFASIVLGVLGGEELDRIVTWCVFSVIPCFSDAFALPMLVVAWSSGGQTRDFKEQSSWSFLKIERIRGSGTAQETPIMYWYKNWNVQMRYIQWNRYIFCDVKLCLNYRKCPSGCCEKRGKIKIHAWPWWWWCGDSLDVSCMCCGWHVTCIMRNKIMMVRWREKGTDILILKVFGSALIGFT